MSAEPLGSGRHDVGLSGPLFFFSYAHSAESAGSRPRKRRIQLFEDLCENVAELVSLPPGVEPGYMDTSIDGGAHWSQELLDVIGNCHVFVALLSAGYFQSKWCSMEWYAFSQRTVIGPAIARANHQTTIVPLIWAPIPEDRVPPVVNAVQRFAPEADLAMPYQREGIYGLLKTNQEAYEAVVWKIAQHIAKLHYDYQVEPHVLEEVELRDIFRRE
jgi:TIR domain-containing protein